MSTPCEQLSYKVGDKFRVTYADIGFEVGQIIELQSDDGTWNPLFIGENCEYTNGLNGEVGGYFSLDNVEKVVDNSQTCSVESPHQVETGWIEWDGGHCPVPRGTLVDVRYRSGEEKFSLPALEMVPGSDASYSYWKNDGMSADIIAYRLTQTTDSTTNTTKQETTQENKTMTSTSLKVNDTVIIKKGITTFRYGSNSWMVEAQREEKVLIISSKDSDGCIYAKGPGGGASFIETELELVGNTQVASDDEYEVKPKLVPFALDSDHVTADQANEILSLAVKLGASPDESAYDSDCEDDDVEEKYPALEDSCHYDIDDYEWVGVDNSNDTLLSDDLSNYNGNVLSYEEAKLMLTGVKRVAGPLGVAGTSETANYKVAPKLVPFYIEMEGISAEKINELLIIAVNLGAKVGEAVTDAYLNADQVKSNFPQLSSAALYPKESFSRIGVTKGNLKTYITGPDAYNSNKLTYEEAKVMLTGIKDEVTQETNKGDTKLTNQKPALKSFYFPIEGVKAEVINNIFKRLVAVGAVLKDTTHDSEEGSRQKVRDEFGSIPGTNCEVACFNLAGLSNRDDGLVTWVNDQASQFDDEAVAMTLEEVLAYVSQLEGKTVTKSKVPTLRQRKVKIVYTNDKGYQLKNVISVDIKSEEGTVNITYKQRKGKVIHNNNVVIPFSELKSVKFVGPKVIGAEYIFKGGKVVQVIQDFTYESFTHKSH